MAEATLEQLQQRVANGIRWLSEHDPSGAFHAWYCAGLTPTSVMPAQDAETRAAYREYYGQRVIFDRLDRELGRVDPAWTPVEPFPWKPEARR